jgi:choline dehydrogenase-like flavoprotein
VSGRHFDVLVAGGGTAGCVLAARLSEDPALEVGLIEAGPDYGPYDAGAWPGDLLDARGLALDSHCWETDRDDRSQLRARVLGGCSAHNACVLVRGTDEDYDEWGDRWRADDLRPYLDRAEQQLALRTVQRDDLSPWHSAFADAAGDATIFHVVNARGPVRWNAAFAYVDPARSRPNLTIVAETLVDRITFAGSRTTGVTTSRGPFSADRVVVTASTYGSPGILLRSGLGPPVGDGLVDHAGVGASWEPTDELRAEVEDWERTHETYMAQITIRADGEMFVFPALDPGCEISCGAFLMKPRSRGSVRLTSPDPAAPLRIDHGFLSDFDDLESIAEGLERLRAFVADGPVARCIARELRPAEVDLRDYVRENVRGFFHPVATCAIGRVVDTDARVIGYDNLYVADASIIPTIPRANTNLSTAAVAERVADLLHG